MTAIRALSLSRPWTTLILDGHKNVENRTWTTPYRGPLIIHGAKSWDGRNAAMTAENILLDWPLGALDELQTRRDQHPTGYLGVVDLVSVCNGECFSCGPWAFKGCCHWKLTNPRRFPAPIDLPGRLSLFEPAVEALDALAQLGVTA